MADVTSELQGAYFKASLLEVAIIHQITAVELVEFDDNKQWVLSFAGIDTKLPLNKTRLTVMADAFGKETDDWIGRDVQLVPGSTRYQGKKCACIDLETVD